MLHIYKLLQEEVQKFFSSGSLRHRVRCPHKIPGLSRTLHLDFLDFPGPGNFSNTIPGLIFPGLSETKLIFQVLEIFKNAIRGLKFPGLSKSWKCYRHNSRTFEVAWDRV